MARAIATKAPPVDVASTPVFKPIPSQLDAISTDFLNRHARYAKQHPLTNINHAITYHNGVLTLLKKEAKGRMMEVARANTPALNSSYKYFKSLAHISVWLNKVMVSLIQQKHPYADNEDLLRIKSHLTVLKT